MSAIATIAAAMLMLQAPSAASGTDEQRLAALEVESHQRWLARDVGALAELMDEHFHFVVMNGAVETRAEVVGTDPAARAAPSPLSVRSLAVRPDQIFIQNDSGVVISTMELDATVRGRPLPPRMRVLSMFTRSGTGWKLLARSITPILPPPPQP